MQRLTGIILIAAAAAAVAGCALRDPRDDYAYGNASDGLWNSTFDPLIDWRFPTSSNQGPIEAPKRFRLERTAIGVTWATRNPLPLNDQSPAQDAPAAASADEAAGPAPVPPPGDAGTAARERGGAR